MDDRSDPETPENEKYGFADTAPARFLNFLVMFGSIFSSRQLVPHSQGDRDLPWSQWCGTLSPLSSAK